jgi:hypothetical protein
MAERPAPPPWGVLIAAALARGGLSARQAARRAGISEGRWRQITGGYQVVSPGVYAQVRGPAATLAKMAAVAGVTGEQLRAAGREDAAELLDQQRDGQVAADEMLDRVRAMNTDQARELLATIARQLGISPADADAAEQERRPDQ